MQLSLSLNSYYLYRHIRLDKYEPFYIGQGNNLDKRKPLYYRANVKKYRNKYWNSIVNKIQDNYKVEILYESSSKDEINKKEIEFINLYKRKCDNGILCNITKGGENSLEGYKWEGEAKINLVKRLKENPPHLNFKHSKDTIDKIKKSKLGKKLSEEHKLNIYKTKINKPCSNNKPIIYTNLVTGEQKIFRDRNIASLTIGINKSTIHRLLKLENKSNKHKFEYYAKPIA